MKDKLVFDTTDANTIAKTAIAIDIFSFIFYLLTNSNIIITIMNL